jgi:hypothetical protein
MKEKIQPKDRYGTGTVFRPKKYLKHVAVPVSVIVTGTGIKRFYVTSPSLKLNS